MSQFHFDPATYPEFIRDEIPQYDELQARLAAATATVTASSILDLGTGTGETLARVLPMHPAAQVIGVD
jgi:trans-aconitate methyltransferase